MTVFNFLQIISNPMNICMFFQPNSSLITAHIFNLQNVTQHNHINVTQKKNFSNISNTTFCSNNNCERSRKSSLSLQHVILLLQQRALGRHIGPLHSKYHRKFRICCNRTLEESQWKNK